MGGAQCGWLLVSKLSPVRPLPPLCDATGSQCLLLSLASALGASDWPCGVRVSHKKVQMSPLNAAPNSNDNSMLMTLTLCQSTSITKGRHGGPETAASLTWVARSVSHLSCRLGRLAVRCAA